ncbi:MAG: TerB family tellurite resistance protein, partial [Burkholderiaceae bacterium]
ERSLALACTALLAEMMRIDYETDPAEEAMILSTVRSRFGLDDADAQALVALAHQQARDSTDYFQFTSLINERYDAAQKLELIETLWELALVDARISDHERHLMRKLAELLHVPHGDHMAAKGRAQARSPSGRQD